MPNLFIKCSLIILLSSTPLWGKSKRYIVHYNVHKSVKGAVGNSVTNVRKIAYGESAKQVISTFALGVDQITSIEEDLILNHFALPGDDLGFIDELYYDQWGLFDSLGGIDLPAAWDITKGSSTIVVAVVDTGVIRHPELEGRVLIGGDFISDVDMSNDGDARDNDATDSGDWIDSTDDCFSGEFAKSSWHGTHVAGTIAANAGNRAGIAGINWKAQILPVRVLGKCGGYISDIADGIRWAAGGSVSGVEDNLNPAQVINLSLGAQGSCSITMQSAIDFARSKGAVVVVAAGNSGMDMDFTPFVPGSCDGVITVGAGNLYAEKSEYSNYGRDIDIMAPGGDRSGLILSLGNTGTTVASDFSYEAGMGTSMAAPHVSGVASLILAQSPQLNPDQLEAILKNSAKYFSCTLSEGCGSGLIDSYSALVEASVTQAEELSQGSENLSFGDDSGESDSRFVTLSENESRGGLCGSVAFVDKGGSGPKGGLGAQLLSLFMGLLMMSIVSLIKVYLEKKGNLLGLSFNI